MPISPTFWGAFWDGLAAPGLLLQGPGSYDSPAMPRNVAEVFGDVGQRIATASQFVMADPARAERPAKPGV